MNAADIRAAQGMLVVPANAAKTMYMRVQRRLHL